MIFDPPFFCIRQNARLHDEQQKFLREKRVIKTRQRGKKAVNKSFDLNFTSHWMQIHWCRMCLQKKKEFLHKDP